MRAPISVVIPTLNAAEALPPTLAALMEGVEAGLVRELVISDGGSSDATRGVAEDIGAVWVEGAASRGGQIGRGVAAARGPWLMVLHADSHLTPGWAEVVAAHLPTNDAACFRLRFRAEGGAARWTAGWANLRTRLFGLPYGDQGLLVRADALAAVGGVPDQPLMEDVALARRLTITPLDHVITTSAERYHKGGWLRRGTRNIITLVRYLMGASPEALARAYRR
ncbi:MAG: TIGR04283 family arsenosugar biosynthesis glycosyltransferase [Shimia sp.]